MSRHRTKTVKFHHQNPCEMSGCPGHELLIEHDHSSDISVIIIDNVPVYYLDDGVVEALRELIAQIP